MMFCKHKWKVLSDKVLPSMFDAITEKEGQLDFHTSQSTPLSFFRKVHHVVVCCDLCGAIKEYKANN